MRSVRHHARCPPARHPQPLRLHHRDREPGLVLQDVVSPQPLFVTPMSPGRGNYPAIRDRKLLHIAAIPSRRHELGDDVVAAGVRLVAPSRCCHSRPFEGRGRSVEASYTSVSGGKPRSMRPATERPAEALGCARPGSRPTARHLGPVGSAFWVQRVRRERACSRDRWASERAGVTESRPRAACARRWAAAGRTAEHFSASLCA